MKITFRKATAADIPTIYSWRNHPAIRKWMFVSKRIPWNEHVRFWKKRLRQRNRFSWIVQADGRDCGVIRLDPDSRNRRTYEIDIYLDPSYHGRGIGSKVLAAVKRMARRKGITTLFAAVKPANVRSQKIFEKNGFVLQKYEYHYILSTR